MLESLLFLAAVASAPKARMPQTDDREARFRSWWNGLTREEQNAKIKAGHVRVNLPSTPDKPDRAPAQMNAERRRARGKR